MKDKDIHILVVEDNPADLRLVEEMVKDVISPRFSISHSGGIKDCLNRLKAENFDVILLDMNLPDSHGLEGLEEVARQRLEIPIIVLTGADDDNLGMQAIQKHASDYLVKGRIDTDILTRSIRYSIERKLVEKDRENMLTEAQLNQQRLRWALSAARGGVWDWDLLSGLLWWSPEMFKLFGVRPDGPTRAEFVFSLIDERDRENVRKVIDARIKDRADLRYQFRIHHPSTGERWMESFGDVVYTVAGAIRIIGITIDISDRKEMEEILKRDRDQLQMLVENKTKELCASQRETEMAKRLSDIGTLAATVAHELRNPLASMKLAVYNIKRKIQEPKIESHLNNIDKKITESGQIINNLLSYSKIKVSHFEAVKIHDLLQESIEELIRNFSDKRASVIKKIDDIRDVSINADPLQLKEVFANILNNALDATKKEDGVIEITTGLNDQAVLIGIKDNGIGIEAEHLPKLFDPFFTTKAKGTGLGLAVCKQIMMLHSGYITVESEKGKGTKMSISLPIRRSGLNPI